MWKKINVNMSTTSILYKRDKRKILVTGSAPYFPIWWKTNISKLDEYEVHSINTSLVITYEKCERWFRSSDFFSLHPELEQILRPHMERIDDERRRKYPRPDPIHITHTISWPFLYWKNGSSGTMLFNVLLEFLNDSFWSDNIEEVNLIGTDLIYKKDTINHFYGKTGTDDPMRLGLDCLQTNLNMFKMAFKRMGVKIFNLSPSTETLLPFDRKTL